MSLLDPFPPRRRPAPGLHEGDVVALLRRIVASDSTPTYEYGEARRSDGAPPPAGQRWATPRELAEHALRRLGSR